MTPELSLLEHENCGTRPNLLHSIGLGVSLTWAALATRSTLVAIK
jgi:hypothetical protein